jgi:hypothetical protein
MKSARRPRLNQTVKRLNRNRNLRGDPQDSETIRFFRPCAGSSSSEPQSGLNQRLNTETRPAVFMDPGSRGAYAPLGRDDGYRVP